MKILLFSTILSSLFLFSCTSGELTRENTGIIKNDVFFFNYSNGDTLKAELLNPADRTREGIIKALLQLLRDRHFSSVNGTSPDLDFELTGINLIEAGGETYRIAVVNISDPENTMQKHYFQGSAGGSQTQNLLITNILQPQHRKFLDGMILLLNDKPVEVSDHVNLEGIITPGSGEFQALNAVRRSR